MSFGQGEIAGVFFSGEKLIFEVIRCYAAKKMVRLELSSAHEPPQR
jgi:hypothetical protein